MLRDNAMIAEVVRTPCDAGDFYVFANRLIFTAIIDLYRDNKAADAVTLANMLKERQQIEEIGGYEYLATLWDAAPSAANAVFYACIVRDKAMLRALIEAGGTMVRDANDQI